MIDFEGWEEPTQIGAVLLDKETLEEKASYSSYIWTDLHGQTSMVSGISQATLEGAPSQAEVGRAVFEKFGGKVLLSAWVATFDSKHFEKLTRAAGLDAKSYDYHWLDVWPLAYTELLKRGYNGSMKSEDIFREFGAAPRDLHDALEDCRIQAEVLRRLVLPGGKS